MKLHPSYDLSSQKRTVSIVHYAKGYEFRWERLTADIETDAFEPKNHDMIHAMNWMKRHLQNFTIHASNQGDEVERLAAIDAWCRLYPFAPREVQGHMVFMLENVPKAQAEDMRKRSKPWVTAMEQAWSRREDTPLWNALCKVIPDELMPLSLKAGSLRTAVQLLRPHVQAWVRDTSLQASVSELIYTTLMRHAEPDLKERLHTYQLLYSDMDDMPKAAALNTAWNSNFTRDAAERMKLESCTQMVSNLLLLDDQAIRAAQAPAFDLPSNVFESLA